MRLLFSPPRQVLEEVESEKITAHIESQKKHSADALPDQRLKSLKEAAADLSMCIQQFWQDGERRSTVGKTEFDKDDSLAMVRK